ISVLSSITSPNTLKTRPNVMSPTGTEIGAPLSVTAAPRCNHPLKTLQLYELHRHLSEVLLQVLIVLVLHQHVRFQQLMRCKSLVVGRFQIERLQPDPLLEEHVLCSCFFLLSYDIPFKKFQLTDFHLTAVFIMKRGEASIIRALLPHR